MKAWKPSCSASFTCSRKRTFVSSPSEQTDTLIDQASIFKRALCEGPSTSRPCESRDPYAVPSRWDTAYGSRLFGRDDKNCGRAVNPSFLVDAAQPAVRRVGLRPLARIGAVDALRKVGADREVDRHVDDPGPAAGDGLAQGGAELFRILDAGAFGPVGVGELHVVGIVALAGVFAGEGAPRMRALIGALHAFALDAELVIVEDHPDGRQIVL